MRLARRTLLAAVALPVAAVSARGEGAAVSARAEVAAPAARAEIVAPPAATERFVWLRNAAGEEVAVAYRRGEEHDAFAMARIARLFRDLSAGAQGPLPPLLVDVLSALQEQWGHARPIVVKSAYRTPATNRVLEGAAPASLHLVGRAVDITVPGLALEDLSGKAWLLAHRLGFMGVGLYRGFVHLDIGPHRVWTRLRG